MEALDLQDYNENTLRTLLFTEHNPNWSPEPEYRFAFIKSIEAFLNHRLIVKGHVFLNEVHDALGFPRTTHGQLTGWLRDGKNNGRIALTVVSATLTNPADQAIYIDVNVDGVIVDKI